LPHDCFRQFFGYPRPFCFHFLYQNPNC
jgi:hypothetical protein